MAAAVDPAVSGVVVELGPGTGSVTNTLIKCGVAPDRLVLVEGNPQFCTLLGVRYPGARLVDGDAYSAPSAIEALGIGPVAAICLRSAAMYAAVATPPTVAARMPAAGRRGAPFVQFTYFYNPQIPVSGGAIAIEVSPMLWRNLWPARVWCYRLRGA